LIFYYGAGYGAKDVRTPPAWELYDLKKDPGENVNQYDNPEYAAIVESLKRQLAEKRAQIGDSGADYPEIEGVIQKFWDFGPAEKVESAEISKQFLRHRTNELKQKKK
jgi:hypothetical protein